MPAARRFGRPAYRFETLDTTMREAGERAEQGAPEGAIVTAEQQTAGRGRLGRSWFSQKGAGLYFSLILRPPVRAADSPVLTLAAGLGVARGVGEACGVQCDLRWPNDVLLNEKKCAGVLVELSAGGDRVRHVIVGVGVNVNHPALPPELAAEATSLRIETGREFVKEAVLDAALEQMQRYYEMFLGRGAAAVIDAFCRRSSYARGKRVEVLQENSRLRGVTAGLDSSGVLLVRLDDGRVTPVWAGGVRPCPPEQEQDHAAGR